MHAVRLRQQQFTWLLLLVLLSGALLQDSVLTGAQRSPRAALDPVLAQLGGLSPSQPIAPGVGPSVGPAQSGREFAESIRGLIAVDMRPGIPVVDVVLHSTGRNAALVSAGAHVLARVGNLVAAQVPINAIGRLASAEGVDWIQAARLLESVNDLGRAAIGADVVQGSLGLDGSGVVVGVIDTGIDVFHQDFRNPDGTTRIMFLLDGSVDANLGMPGIQPTEFNEAEINAALLAGPPFASQDTDVVGHGSHVAGTAAGDGSATGPGSAAAGTFAGVAPGALIIAVDTQVASGGLSTATIIDGLAFVDEKAAVLGLPWVANLSLGGHAFAAHDGTSPIELAIDALVGPGVPGKAVVVAAGNDGARQIHASGVVPAADPGVDTIALNFSVPVGMTGIILDVWYEQTDFFRVGFISPLGSRWAASTDPVPFGFTTASPGFCDIESCVQVTNASAAAFGIPTGAHLATFFLAPDISSPFLDITPGTWTIELERTAASGGGGSFDSWTSSAFVEFTTFADSASRIGAPATALNAIAVAAFMTRAGQDSVAVGELASFSSDGPTRDGRLKPDIAAPGTAIFSSASSTATGGLSFAVGMVHHQIQGTSMAAPHVTGAVALLLQANPHLDAIEIRDLLTSTATSDTATGATPNNRAGFGKLNINAALGTITIQKDVRSSTGNTADAPPNPALDGFVFEVRETGTSNLLETVSTDATGEAIVVVPVGTYDVVEVDAQGLTDLTGPEFVVAVTSATNTPVPWENRQDAPGTITIQKAVLSFDGSDAANPVDPTLSDFGFEIRDAGTGDIVTTLSTDMDGLAITTLVAGSYDVVEVDAQGLTDDTVLQEDVLVVPGGNADVPWINLQLEPGTLTVTKTGQSSAGGLADNPADPSLAGFVFEVRMPGGEVVETLVTDISGSASVALADGTYDVFEVDALGLSDETGPVTGNVVSSSTSVSIPWTNQQSPPGTISVQKVVQSSAGGAANNPPAPSLAGFGFEVREPGTANVVASGVTDDTGRVSFSLAVGTYDVVETDALGLADVTGIEADVSVMSGAVSPLTWVNQQDPPGTITITKSVRSSTGEDANNPPRPGLGGFEFTVREAGTANTVASGTTNASGTVVIGVPVGLYDVVETNAQGLTDVSLISEDVAATSGADTSIPWTNHQLPPGTITITKSVSSSSGGVADNPAAPSLLGFGFEVREAGTTVVVAAGSTDAAGELNVTVPVGSYDVVETDALGLTDATASAAGVIVVSGADTAVTWTNQQVPLGQGSITIRKVLETAAGAEFVTAPDALLSGFEFEVTAVGAGAPTATPTTDVTGVVVVAVPAGDYEVVETAVQGLLDTTGLALASVAAGEHQEVVWTNQNRVPESSAHTYTVLEDDSLPVLDHDGTVTGGDSSDDGLRVGLMDADGDPITLALVSGPSDGTLIGGLSADGTFTYQSALNFSGADAFRYTVSDGINPPVELLAEIDVIAQNDPPVAEDDAFSVVLGGTVSGSVLLDNGNGADSDVEDGVPAGAVSLVPGDPDEAAIFTLAATGAFTYTHDGSDPPAASVSFQYTVLDSDGQISNVAIVTIEIFTTGTLVIQKVVDSSSGGPADNPASPALDGFRFTVFDAGMRLRSPS